MSIRARITLYGVVVVTVVLGLFCAAAILLLSAAVEQDQDDALARRADQALAGLPATPPEARPLPPAVTDPRLSTELYIVLLGPQGTVLTATGVPPALPAELLDRAKRDGRASGTVEVAAGTPVRVHVRSYPNGYVVAAQTTRRVTEEQEGVLAFTLAYAVVSFPVAMLAIWLVAGRALRPLGQLAGLADEFGRSGDLARRLPPVARRDALGRLTTSFNAMMDRLQSAFTAQQRFTADASHELRTPLTTIRNNAGFLLANPDAAPADRDAALRDLAGESDRMSRLLDSLLTLARADAGQRPSMVPVDLAELVADVCARARVAYPDRKLSCAANPTAPVHGDADSLTQLLWILLDNAAKFAGPGGRIWVAVTQRGRIAQLHVSDDGPGLPDGAAERIFERFYQGDSARSGRGAGLGLAIAHWIAQAHGGSILAANNAKGGASFVVELPPAGAEPKPLPPAA